MAPLRVLQLLAHTALVVASSAPGTLLVDAAARRSDVEVESTSEAPKDATTIENICAETDETCSLPNRKTTLTECGVWLAPSTLPGAGLGVFAGKDFKKEEPLLVTGDVVIPIVDIMMHNKGRKRFIFLWDEYTWNGNSLGLGHEVMMDCNAASPGFGAATNSFLDLVNIEEGDPKNEMPHGLHRSKDPGVGAFSTYHDRRATAKINIKKGQELFVNYGSHWFEQRSRLGPIPLRRGLKKSTNFYRKFKKMRDDNPSINENIFDEVWDVFVKQTAWNESRIFGAFYHTESERVMLEANKTLKQIRVAESTRTQEWFEEHGTCADHLRGGISTIRQAGWGAFANRNLPEGEVVSHLPLIQIIDKSVLRMYVLQEIKTKKKPSQRTLAGHQIMTNYCYGHLNSTMLLCPYGLMASLVNHNQTKANVRLQWSDPNRSNHVPEMLEKPIEQFAKDRTASLAMDLVATRPIAEGEEIFLDYGDAWERAWQDHVKNWNPEGAGDYISAFMLNEHNASSFRTEFEQMKDPYPGNVNIECDSNIWSRTNRTLFQATHTINITDPDSHKFWNCDILRRREVNGTNLYTVVVERPQPKKKKKKKKKVEDGPKYVKLTDIPSVAIRFTDRPYTSDMFLEEAFRHPVMIPDDIFPEEWKNFSPII